MSEFGFIDAIRSAFASLPDNGFEGIGDDCAVLPLGDGESLLFTTDMLGEGTHFLRHAASAREIGAKSLAVNISDIAAMGGRPVASLLSLALPDDAIGWWAEEFMVGYRVESERWGVPLVGGDTTRSAAGISVSVTAIGRVRDCSLKRRSAALAGDVVMVSGVLGASAAGLRDILAGRLSTANATAHRNPYPQVDEGIWLGGQPCVHAMMDISDGIASDLCHILEESGAGAVVDTAFVPVADGATIEDALCGGEDYKLLFTVAPECADGLSAAFRERFGTPLYTIGSIVAQHAGRIEWRRCGAPIHPDWHGFSHF